MKIEFDFGWDIDGPELTITVTIRNYSWYAGFYTGHTRTRRTLDTPSLTYTDQPDLTGTNLDDLHWGDLGASNK